MLNLDEAVLLEGCRKGEEQAFRQLISRYQQSVFGVVCYLGACDQNRAYELTVTSFVEAVHAIQASGNTRSFLRTLLPTVIEKARDLKPSPTFEAPNVPGLPPEQHQLLRVVKQVLLALPFEARLLLLLRDQMGLRYEDIASIVGSSTQEARSNMIRARAQLRDTTKETLDRIR